MNLHINKYGNLIFTKEGEEYLITGVMEWLLEANDSHLILV